MNNNSDTNYQTARIINLFRAGKTNQEIEQITDYPIDVIEKTVNDYIDSMYDKWAGNWNK